MLERKIGKIDETIKKNRDLNGILKTVKDSVGGTAEAMGKTFEGQVNILKASVDDFNEQLGFIITSSPVVRSAMQMISESFISATENIGAARQETNNFYETWLRVSAGIIGVATAIKAVWKGLLLVFQTVWLVISKILEGLVGMIYSFLGILDFFVQRLPFLSKATKESFASLVEEAKGWVITFENATKETQQNIGVTINSLSNLGTEALNTFGKLEGGAQKFAKSMNESLKGAANPVEELKQKFIATNFIVTQYAISMRDTLRDVLVDGFKTGFKNIGDILANFGDIMLKTIMEAIANMILLKTALAIFGVPLGFSGGASVGGGGISPGSGITATVHSGGYIYAPNAVYGQGRRKFHSGGEVPATLLEGEGVLNRNAMRNMGVNNLDRLNRGEATGGSVVNNYYIQTIDERSFRERLSQHGDIYTSASEQGLRDNHSLRQVSQRYRR